MKITITISLLMALFVYVQTQTTYQYYTNNSCTVSTGRVAFMNNACVVISSSGAIKYYCSGDKFGNVNYLTGSCSSTGKNNELGSTNMCGAHSTGDIINCGKNVPNTNLIVASTISYGGLSCNGTAYSGLYYYSGCQAASSTTSQKYTCSNNTLTITNYNDKTCTSVGSIGVYSGSCSARDIYSEKIFCGYVDVENTITPNSAGKFFLSVSLIFALALLF
jgi:hypothetical protein